MDCSGHCSRSPRGNGLRLLAGRRVGRVPTRALAGSRRHYAAVSGVSTPPRSSWAEKPGHRAASSTSSSTSCTSGTFTAAGTFDAAIRAAPELARARRHGGRGDAGSDVPRRARLGLRRRLTWRRTGLRRARGAGAASSTRRTQAGSGCCWTSSTTTSARARSSSRFGPYFTDRHETFWGDAIDYTRAACASGRSRTPSSGCATTASTASGSTRRTRSSTTVSRTCFAELAERVHAVRPGCARDRPRHRSATAVRSKSGAMTPVEDDVPPCVARPPDREHDGYYERLRNGRRLARAFEATTAGAAPVLRVPIMIRSATAPSVTGYRPLCAVLAAACLLFAPQVPLLFRGDETAR